MKRSRNWLFWLTILVAMTINLPVNGDETAAVDEAEKSELRILYVGPNPDGGIRAPSYISGADAERFVELKKERKAAFKSLLEQYFSNVELVNAEDYVPSMSEKVDVTIFDELTPALRKVDVGGWQKPIRLPDNFHHASLMVGEVGPLTLGRHGLGLQIGHL